MPVPPVTTPSVRSSPTSEKATANFISAIVDSSFDAIISKDLTSTIQSWNNAAEQMFGYTAQEAVGRSVLMLIPESLRSEEDDIIARIKRGERVESFETVRCRKDGTSIAVFLTISPVKDEAGTIIGASTIARDITPAKEAEQRIRILLREVNHRMKNQFAVILSIIRETSNRSTSQQEFEARVRDRIMALSRSHDLLVNTDWAGASLAELIYEHLNVFGHDEQVVISGPLVTLNANAVQNLGMAMHELGTNSAKYGALADGGGSVKIEWRIHSGQNGARRLEIIWDEFTENPKIRALHPTERRGFGSVVLDRVVPISLGGVATLARTPQAVRWTLDAPWESLTQQA
jgi:PAS domain S-box-containing protein